MAEFPEHFQVRTIETNGAALHVRIGGHGPAVVMLHGFGETGESWAALAAVLCEQHRVIVPDLRGMGRSSHPDNGYTKANQARDILGILAALDIERVDLVAHDIGNMVAYAFAARYQEKVGSVVLMDAPIPGLGDWAIYSQSPKVWHWNFRGADVERLVEGRERIYLDRFWNEMSVHPAAIDEDMRERTARLYALPGAMHCAFEQFAALRQDAEDNRRSFERTGKLPMPALAIGGDHSYAARMADIAGAAFKNVRLVIISDAGHWLMEERPDAVIHAVQAFLEERDRLGAQVRNQPAEANRKGAAP